MKLKQIILGVGMLFSMFTSCQITKEKDSNIEEIVVDDIFLSVVDTLAYSYNTLLPSIFYNKTKQYRNTDSFLVAVNNNLKFPIEWVGRIKSELNSNNIAGTNDTAFLVFTKSLDSYTADQYQSLNVKKVLNTGQYRVTSNYDFTSKETASGMIGVVRFSMILFNQSSDRAITVVAIKDHVKSGIEELLLLTRTKNKWVITNRISLAVS